MQLISQFFHHLHSLHDLIRWGGLIVLTTIIFAETGLLVGFFLPGDSLLFVAGAIAATGTLNVGLLMVVIAVGAVVGNTANYAIGAWLGHKIYDGTIRWMNVTDHLKALGKKPPKQIEFTGEPFTALNLVRLRDRVFPREA